MLAELPKNDPISGGASSTLYYFPEIPSGIEKKAMAGNSHASFVSGAPRQNNDFGHLSQSASRETPDASLMVEEAFAKGLEQGRSETGAVLQEKSRNGCFGFQHGCSVHDSGPSTKYPAHGNGNRSSGALHCKESYRQGM